MVCCALAICGNRNLVETKKGSGITYHRFPRDAERRNIWIQFVNRGDDWQPNKYSVLCSKHFEEKSMDRTSLCCVRLREAAVPTIITPVTNGEDDSGSTKLVKHLEDGDEIIINVMENQFVCNVCLQGAQKLVSVCETPQDNIKWIIKLHTFIPEVNWDESFMICDICSKQLDEVYNFRNLCISSNISNLCSHRDFDSNNTGCTLCKVMKVNSEVDHIEEHLKKPEEPVVVKTIRKNNRISNLPCDNCGLVCTSGAKLVNHCVTVHGYKASDVKPFQCDLCFKSFSKSSYLTNHKQYHAGIRKFICTFCGKGFITLNDLVNHEKRHLNKTQSNCENCSKSFSTVHHLKEHIEAMHKKPTDWQYACPYCDKRCATLLHQVRHIRAHSRKKRFACHLCKKRFGVKIALQKHVATHWNIKPFKCEHCKKKYKSESAFHVHLKRVHDIGDVEVRKN